MHVNYRVWKFHSGRWKQGLLLCGYGLHGVRTGLTCEETADLTPVSNYQESCWITVPNQFSRRGGSSHVPMHSERTSSAEAMRLYYYLMAGLMASNKQRAANAHNTVH